MLIVALGRIHERAMRIRPAAFRIDADRLREIRKRLRIILLVEVGETAPLVRIGVARIARYGASEQAD